MPSPAPHTSTVFPTPPAAPRTGEANAGGGPGRLNRPVKVRRFLRLEFGERLYAKLAADARDCGLSVGGYVRQAVECTVAQRECRHVARPAGPPPGDDAEDDDR